MIVLLDMDDVLCDFIGAVLELIGIDETEFMRRVPATDGNWRITSLCGIPEELVWEMIDRRGYAFWRGLKPLPWARLLWDELHRRFGSSLYICTAPQPTIDCYRAKVEWVWYYLLTTNIILCPDKSLLSTDNAIIIDDNPSVVKHFGSNGRLFPAINNSGRREWLRLRRRPERVIQLVESWFDK